MAVMGEPTTVFVDGGPAFPVERALHRGMSLRDFLAAAALQGCGVSLVQGPLSGESEHIARRAYAIADSMLKVRAEE